ncbi:phospholipase B1, membrane-associated [Pristis pectinata]|uniref:phospholipase B1, membrane-associated n=1 Tax=Pristis pectinata TaxID=685728 RepID=UPI00223CCF3F|nr:phospholipase B1, membrane-associated [Pristis pectinata]
MEKDDPWKWYDGQWTANKRCESSLSSESFFIGTLRLSCDASKWRVCELVTQSVMDPWVGCAEGTFSSPASVSVHTLRPSEVKVVAMMGDSLIAGSTQATEQTARIGEDPSPRMQGSFPDILKSFNPDLIGYSSDNRNHDNSLDQSTLRVKAEELPGQALKLVNSLKSQPEYYSPENVAFRIKEALDILYQEVPRTFVNVVEMQDIDLLLQHYDLGLSTNEPRNFCDCLVKLHNSGKLSAYNISRDYRNALQELVYSGIYDKREDYTVVLQPFLRNLELPLTAEMPYLFTYQNSDYGVNLRAEARSSGLKDFGSEVTCTERAPSDTVPVSVHKLRPADIKVIAALGDSITAGNGAGSKPNDLVGVLTQFRGLSWSIGGDKNITTVTTLTNILREFNPSLIGYSTDTGHQDTPQAFLNQAVMGSVTGDLMAQVKRILQLMKNDSRINFQEDWKIITLFVGGNDLCDYCKNTWSSAHSSSDLASILTFDVACVRSAAKVHQTGSSISFEEGLSRLICKCVINPTDNSAQLSELKALNREYQKRTHLLIESGRYDTREDFTVVIQPFLEDSQIPRDKHGMPDKSYFAADCFHFNVKAHSQAARSLWKNLLEPVGRKTMNQSFDEPIYLSCPSKDEPYLRTYKNSNYTYPNNSGQATSVAPVSTETTVAPSHKPSMTQVSLQTTPSITGTTREPSQIYGSELLCKDRTPSDVIPNSVHSLRPADVKVIAAVGDSLTAGNGIGSKPNDILDVLTQYRGLSFSIGGDGSLRITTTLPNILREFNPSLTGFSTGKGNLEKPNVFLNQAFPGALAGDLPGQVRKLLDIMKNNTKIDFQNDWKIINLFIGGNDLCNYCTDSAHFSGINFAKRIEEALDILHNEVPRAFVNLIEVLQLIPLRSLYQDKKLSCPRTLMRMLCYCVVKPSENSPELEMMSEANRAYQRSTQMLVESGRYDSREDFTVVLQPFFRHVQIPILENGHLDTSFFAPDCFHLSQKFHTQMARALWNNMLQPVGEKSDFQDVTANISLSCPSQDQPFLRTFRNSNYTYQGADPTADPPENWGSDLACEENLPSETVPTSVHRVRPADVKVVGALGDSITVGFGAQAKNLFQLRTQYQGVSWSIGGDKTLEAVTTLPNILKKFNPNIYGFASGIGKRKSKFNVAVPDSKAKDMAEQAGSLIQLMKKSSKINFEKDWKVITLFIGANDLCDYCMNKETYSADNYVKHIQEALDILQEQVPRAFVNIMQILEMKGIRRIKKNTIGCALLQKNICPCFLKLRDDSPELSEMLRVNREYQTKLTALIDSGRYDTSEDFTVVLQPYFTNTIIPLNIMGLPELGFFSVDCFHLSERGHAEMAIGLWNNMLEPVGHKQNYNNFTYDRNKLKCPSSDSPYLFTRKNSAEEPEVTPGSEAEQSIWAAVLIAIAGVIVGAVLVLIMAKLRFPKCRQHDENPLELNGIKL